ncbi:fimbrial biogenesis chaperone [Pseudomonas sp. MDT1-17]
MSYLMRFSVYLCFLVSMVFASPAYCSVVLIGTRIIYPASASDKSLQFTSQDAYPSLVQIWVDKGNPQSKPETADAPFVATPQIFRVNSNAGQLVRLVFTGADLPSDRESVFYLNFMQVPALKADQLSSNLLLLAVTSRVKLFYRPLSLKGDADSIASTLKFKLQGSGASARVQVENGSGFHAVIRQASLVGGGQSIPLVSSVMLSPKSTDSWSIPASTQPLPSGRRLHLTLINDLGADIVSELALE